MSATAFTPAKPAAKSAPSPALVSRSCACGQHAMVGDRCESCRRTAPDGQRRETDGAARRPRAGGSFVRVPAQSGLRVSQPGDPQEREAEATADAVMQQREAPTGSGPAVLARRATTTGPDDDRAATPETSPALADGPTPARLDATQSQGEPMDEANRHWFESRLGQDLRGVRVHHDARAAQLALQLGADAFTRGQHVYFAAGRYAPTSDAGRRLLAHELTHTLQQGATLAGDRGRVDRQAAVDDPPALRPLGADPLDTEPPAADPLGTEPLGTDSPGTDSPGAGPLDPTGAPAEEMPGTVDDAPPEPATEGPDAAGTTDTALSGAPTTVERSPGTEATTGAEATTSTERTDGAAADPSGTSEGEPAALDTSSGAALLQSLATVPPSRFAAATAEAEGAVPAVQQQETTELAASLPEIERPSGLPRRSEVAGAGAQPTPAPGGEPAPPVEAETAAAPTAAPAASQLAESPHPSTPLPAAQAPVPTAEPTETDDGGWWGWVTRSLRRLLRAIPATDQAVDISAGPRPRVDTSGEADPRQNDEEQRAKAATVSDRRAAADTEADQPRGEGMIYPDVPGGTMRSSHRPTGAGGRAGEGAGGTGGGAGGSGGGAGGAGAAAATGGAAMATVAAGADRAAGPYLAAQVQERADSEAVERQELETESTNRREATRREIAEETSRVRAEQSDEQTAAIGAVGEQRTEWRRQNLAAQEKFGTDAAAERTSVDAKVTEQVSGTQERADTELSRAEEVAKERKREIERQVAAKKAEAKNKPRGFWSRVRGAVGDFFDRIKAAVNRLFNELRAFVRRTIDRAKALVKGWIEAARRALVGLIRGFGAFLKTAAGIALAAFPEASARARRWIDDRVEGAVETVNDAAEALQDFAAQALDALAAGLDFILSVYQRFYTALIDGLRFLAVGLVEIMERIAHLVTAAGLMPDHFFGQATEELVGQDLTQPLPFELTAPRAPATEVATAVAAGSLPAADGEALTSTTFGDDDVVVDSVAPLELSPQLLESLDLPENGSIEFGENSDPSRSLAAIQEELAGGAAAEQPAGPDRLETVTEGPDDLEAAAGPDDVPVAEEQTTEQRLQAMMDAEPDAACAKEASTQPAGPSTVPEEMKFGPLTVGQRARYLLNQMWKGIRHWFSCNWPWLLAAVLALLTVGIILQILTGGAITAAIPPLMQLVGMILIGVAMVRVAGYVGGYLTKGWAGDVAGAAKDLARGLAVGAIELVFTLLFDLNAVLKAAKQGLTATLRSAATTARTAGRTLARSGRRIVRAGARTVRAPGRSAALVRRVALRRGRLVMTGVRRGFATGAHTLDDLARRLWDTVRFRRFKLVRRGRRIQLWALINPWLLLADGDVIQVETTGGRPVLGARYTTEAGQSGVLIGVRDTRASRAVGEVKDLSREARQQLYRELREVGPEGAEKLLRNRETTAALRRGIPGEQPKHFHAHHVIPRELRSTKELKDFLTKIGFHWEDGARNGLMLPPSRELARAHPAWKDATLHFTSHRGYTLRVQRRLIRIATRFESRIQTGTSEARATAMAIRELDTYLAELKDGLMTGAIKLD